MRIPICESLRVARRIVGMIRFSPRTARECVVKAWSNGREQGFHISRLTWDNDSVCVWAVNVAQARSSDSIIVLYGNGNDFDGQTNQMSEEIWEKQKKYFLCNEEAKAAKFITRYLGTGKV